MKLSDLVDEFAAAREVGLLLTEPELADCALRAVRFYAGYGDIASIAVDTPATDPAQLTGDTDLTIGEWAVAAPLFYLYVELMNSTRIEASRSSGVEPYGRSSSEVQQDINVMESETLPAKCFSSEITTIE